MSDLPFTLDQLRILKAIAVEGSFKRAADSLYVSQPAVSLQVQNLERQLDVPLFDRGGRRAQLTEAGHLLLSYGEKILSLCQETCRAIEDLQNLQGGTFNCRCFSNHRHLSFAQNDRDVPTKIC
ncbi:hypothetical protein ANSO36C_49340 [Nostoc cf. commune SO-36]|uniref:HTH lysR-type domain-containing protein n=1 Tax=Nostoc cf. commune SO-36 TaxID=449208 RepID=A0ABN6QCG0_NOSCO|nr:hypothetical protein ANSO36C_49340 [Nostoc cf. commune SO-36]